MAPRRRPKEDEGWHLDRRVPVAIILTMALQTGSVVWWAASANERLTVLERRAESVAPQAERLARVEANVETVKEGISEIKQLLRARNIDPGKRE